jgi:fatty-acyl-CoA synthase
VVAVVAASTESALTDADVLSSVRAQLSAFKAPKQVIFVDEVPRAPNGKADYRAAKALAGGG